MSTPEAHPGSPALSPTQLFRLWRDVAVTEARGIEVLAVDDALTRLAALDEQQARGARRS